MAKQEYSELGRIIRDIITKKGLSMRGVAERVGYKSPNNLRDRLLENYGGMRVDTLAKICDAMGVELCIMDGYKKYRLTKKEWSPEVDVLLNRLASESDCTEEDRYQDRLDRYRENNSANMARVRAEDREGYNTYMREYRQKQARKRDIIETGNLCLGCEYYEKRLKKNGKAYCIVKDRYTLTEECKDYKPRQSEDTEEI